MCYQGIRGNVWVGIMRDPNRIPRILMLIETIWLQCPDLRLCQLIGNCFANSDLYYIDDDELERKIRETYYDYGFAVCVSEFVELLTEYLDGKKTVADCDEWLAGVDWDMPLPELYPAEYENYALLELLAHEIAHGWRSEEEFRIEARRIVGNVALR